MTDHHPSGQLPRDLRRLDDVVTDAVRLHGGLGAEEHPTEIVLVAKTLGWRDDGTQYSDLHVICPGAASAADVANLLREGLGQTLG